MPELVIEIGGREFEVACEPGQEQSLQYAARLLDAEAGRVTDSIGRSTEKRMLLLAGLMLADTMTALEGKLRETEDRLRAADERTRIAEAKAAMLAANALKLETAANHQISKEEVDQLAEEHQAALAALNKVLTDVETLADEVGSAPAK